MKSLDAPWRALQNEYLHKAAACWTLGCGSAAGFKFCFASTLMRSVAFNIAFWLLSIFYAVAAAVASLVPSSKPVRSIAAHYARSVVWVMDHIAGIHLEIRGRQRVPDSSFILAPKHASFGDGFCAYAQFNNLALVAGDHLERIPLLKTILKRLGAIVVNNYGGAQARDSLNRNAARAHTEGLSILIYPEGHLTAVGVYYSYRSGVYHMARNLNMPVVPAASSLGVFWSKEEWKKTPGTAVLEFLEPIEAVGDEDAFIFALQNAIEEKTAQLVAEARGTSARQSVFGLSPSEAKRAAKSKR